MLRISNVHKRYGRVEVLRGLDLELTAGEFVTLLGPSGCGKTTLLRLIAGLEVPDAGEIRLDDEVLAGPSVFRTPQQRNFGMVFQSYALWPHMTVGENLAYPLQARRIAANEIAQRVSAMLETLALAGLGARRPGELSGGQQQRVALGRALIAKPHLLLLDEPLSNVDAKVRQEMRIRIRRVQQEFGLTAIYVTHDQTEAMSMSDRVVVMNHGAIEQAGSPEELYRRPATLFVADFMGNNLLRADVVRCDGAGAIAVDVASLGERLVVDGDAPVGTRITLSVPPEAVEVRARDDTSPPPSSAASTARLVVTSFLGDRIEADVECEDGTMIRGRLATSAATPTRGCGVDVRIDTSRTTLLPATSAGQPATGE